MKNQWQRQKRQDCAHEEENGKKNQMDEIQP